MSIRASTLWMTIITIVSSVNLAFGAQSPILPDPSYTPGVSIDIKKGNVCVIGYTNAVRNVSESLRNKVFSIYKLDRKDDKYEIDHLVSLEIGGANDIANLWPQSYTTQPWNARVKDKLENRLHHDVCKGIISIDEAQGLLKRDWIESYCAYYNDKKVDCQNYLKNRKQK